MSSERVHKINEQIKRYVGDIILRELSLKKTVLVTLAKVDTTPDLRYTRVFVSVYPESDFPYVMKTLEKEKGRIQSILHKKLQIKIPPRVEFRPDSTESQADKIEKLLKEI